MSLAPEQSNQPLVTPVFLDSHSPHHALSQALLELSQCTAIYSGDVEAATAAVTYSIVKNLGTTNCQVWLYTEDRNLFQLVADYGPHAANTPLNQLHVDNHIDYFHCLTQQDWLVLNTGDATTNQLGKQPGKQPGKQLGQPSSTDDKDAPLLLFPPYLSGQEQTITALIEIPIYHQTQIIGVLCCNQQESPRVWQAADKHFMITAAGLIALAISHASEQKKQKILSKQKRQLKLEMIERQQAEQAWHESQHFIQGILNASTNILYVNDFASGENYYINGYMKNILGYSPEEIQKFGAQFLERLAHAETIQAIHQTRKRLAKSTRGEIVENEYRFRHKQGDWLWMLCRETIFQWNSDGTPQQLLGTATDITAHKENAQALQQQNQALTALARVDGLTQIANRRAFDEFLDKAWKARNNTPLTLILCDIDYFKLYNDTYGHQAGDACLQEVAQALKTAVKREPDFVARYGGEEFAVVLPNTIGKGAQHVAETIRAAVHALHIEHHLSDVSPWLTVSLGIGSVTSTDQGTYEAIIAAADQGLYQAKSNGRNQFAIGHVEISQQQ
ncbi:diguanylate cyclase [Leptolyngbyaceae cyanobacterium CCMR0082]|uniref:Diguanylate cyclase n=1 Tax=Adonisia turfae CCMR0082 TaxID=2304604 RepID=A0A6M0SIB0_9CYAN|nr:diguanylate cyclase [Adonisia turfae]MDV3352575.1 diguanylate cyclase [Leptothoe sp. LEGE 181152]NEZ67322.1 diguanylate cyclase [Adonisia turfae CCMR0082]